MEQPCRFWCALLNSHRNIMVEIRKRIDWLVEFARARSSALRIGGAAVWTVAAAFGLAAGAAIAAHCYLVGFAFFTVYAVSAVLVGSPALSKLPAAPHAALGRVCNATGVAVMPFAFAIADPGRALAASFLLFALVASTAASIEPGQHGTQNAPSTTSVRLGRGAVFWRVALCLGLAVACLQHEWFSLIAYLLGALAFVVAGFRVVASVTDFGS